MVSPGGKQCRNLSASRLCVFFILSSPPIFLNLGFILVSYYLFLNFGNSANDNLGLKYKKMGGYRRPNGILAGLLT